MKRSSLIIGVSLLVSFLFFGCGGGGDDEGSSVGNLAGTWLGVVEDDTGTLQNFSLKVDTAGQVVEVKIGVDVTGDTGHINEDWDENLFHVRIDNPGIGSPLGGGVMIVDNSYRHATYGDSGLFFGVLEKGAASLPAPAYTLSDIMGNYPVGGAYAFTQDNTGTWNWEGDAISITVNADLTFSGSSPDGPFSGGFNPQFFNPNYGGYAGTMDVTPPNTLDIKALVSPDKTFVAAYAKNIGTNPMSLDDYLLIGLVK